MERERIERELEKALESHVGIDVKTVLESQIGMEVMESLRNMGNDEIMEEFFGPPRTHLVLVCCHATFFGNDPDEESAWILQDFQKSNPDTGKVGEHHTFNQHVAAGVSILLQDPHAYLIFSGGKTQDQIDMAEADGYEGVLIEKYPSQYGQGREEDANLSLRCDAEPYATDSYQNLLFSILRFKSYNGSYPAKITVITHAFKERRFLELHGPAIKYPADRLRVLGINPPMTLAELQ